LHVAVIKGQVDTVKALLEAGANPEMGSWKSRKTPLYYAANQKKTARSWVSCWRLAQGLMTMKFGQGSPATWRLYSVSISGKRKEGVIVTVEEVEKGMGGARRNHV